MLVPIISHANIQKHMQDAETKEAMTKMQEYSKELRTLAQTYVSLMALVLVPSQITLICC